MLELLFIEQARTSKVVGVRDYERDYRFDPVRRWEIDFAWLSDWAALEIEGGIWTAGAHARGAGIQRDIDKGNALTLAGWRLVRASAADVNEGRAIAMIERLLSGSVATSRRPQRPRSIRTPKRTRRSAARV